MPERSKIIAVDLKNIMYIIFFVWWAIFEKIDKIQFELHIK